MQYLEPMEKGKKRNLCGLIDGFRDFEKMFEDGPPPDRIVNEITKERKEREWKEKMLEHLKTLQEERKQCKYSLLLNSRRSSPHPPTSFAMSLPRGHFTSPRRRWGPDGPGGGGAVGLDLRC